MAEKARYAIYFVPEPDSALYRFGASVLGYDCYGGSPPPIDDLPPNWPALVKEPQRYGFHATFKAPFYLPDGMTEGALCRALDAFARWHFAVNLGPVAVRELGSFIALVPQAPNVPLDKLAADCVREFEPFREPLSDADRQRRLNSGLTRRQNENLDRWGYPYVFDEFRFHMTLTGSLSDPERRRVLSFLCHKFEALLPAQTLTVSQIVVAKQSGRTAPFTVLEAAALGNSPYQPFACSI